MNRMITNRELMERDLTGRRTPVLSDGTPLSDLIDLDKREVKMRVLNDPEIHRLELKYIFSRAWIAVGHASEIPEVGDYVKRPIGQDQVIVTRGRDGEISALLNVCSHRGMEICRADQGNQASFKCPYHGWVFDHGGNLLGAPFEKEMYGAWDKRQYGLRKAHVAIRHGVIFAAFDPICDLSDWLGQFTFYFDTMYGSADLVALGKAAPKQTIRSNWKAAAEQNAGDGYHTVTLHRSMMELGLRPQIPSTVEGWGLDCYDLSSVQGHGLRVLEMDHTLFKTEEQRSPFPIGWFVAGSMFPGVGVGMNASRGGGAMFGAEQKQAEVVYSANVGAMNPAGPGAYHQWSIQLVQKNLPEPVKTGMQRNAIFAVFGADDPESWESVTRSAQGYVGQQQPIRYNAILGSSKPEGFPPHGLVHRGMSKDDNQWHFWLRWYDMMTLEAAAR